MNKVKEWHSAFQWPFTTILNGRDPKGVSLMNFVSQCPRSSHATHTHSVPKLNLAHSGSQDSDPSFSVVLG